MGGRKAWCVSLLRAGETSREDSGTICPRPKNGWCMHQHPPTPPQFFLLSGSTLRNVIPGPIKSAMPSEGQTYLPIQKCKRGSGEGFYAFHQVTTFQACISQHCNKCPWWGWGCVCGSVPCQNKFGNAQITIKQFSLLQDFSEPLGGNCALATQSARQFPNLFYLQNGLQWHILEHQTENTPPQQSRLLGDFKRQYQDLIPQKYFFPVELEVLAIFFMTT